MELLENLREGKSTLLSSSDEVLYHRIHENRGSLSDKVVFEKRISNKDTHDTLTVKGVKEISGKKGQFEFSGGIDSGVIKFGGKGGAEFFTQKEWENSNLIGSAHESSETTVTKEEFSLSPNSVSEIRLSLRRNSYEKEFSFDAVVSGVIVINYYHEIWDFSYLQKKEVYGKSWCIPPRTILYRAKSADNSELGKRLKERAKLFWYHKDGKSIVYKGKGKFQGIEHKLISSKKVSPLKKERTEL